MIDLEYTSKFKRKYKKLIRKNPQLKSRIKTQLEKFIENPFLGGLHSHKVIINDIEVFSFSVTGDIRIAYRWEGDIAVLIDIDTHNNLYR